MNKKGKVTARTSPMLVLILTLVWSGATRVTAQVSETEHERITGDLKHYHGLILDYRRGSDAAVQEIMSWDQKRIQGVLAAIETADDEVRPWEGDRFKAAAMMHTDAALTLLETQDTSAISFHLDRAGWLLQKAGKDLRPFASRWYLAVSRCLRDRNGLYAAERFLTVGRRRLPDDATVLYESANTAEAAAASMYSPDVDVQSMVQRRMGFLNDAGGWLREALTLDGDFLTARLHLGRVDTLRGREKDALIHLENVFNTTNDDATAYLAALFAGAAHERLRHSDDAALAYGRAIRRFPLGHAAYVALSEVLQRSGQADESRLALRSLLDETMGATREPWWWYLDDPPGVADQRLDTLRSEVRH